jgi:hypothetical protein
MGGLSIAVSNIQPRRKAIVRHSNAGISRALSARAGQVAHSGIATVPSRVQAFGEFGLQDIALRGDQADQRIAPDGVLIATVP